MCGVNSVCKDRPSLLSTKTRTVPYNKNRARHLHSETDTLTQINVRFKITQSTQDASVMNKEQLPCHKRTFKRFLIFNLKTDCFVASKRSRVDSNLRHLAQGFSRNFEIIAILGFYARKHYHSIAIKAIEERLDACSLNATLPRKL